MSRILLADKAVWIVIITCDKRKEIAKETIKRIKHALGVEPVIFNEKSSPGIDHKGLNETAVVSWGIKYLKEGEWILRLEDDINCGKNLKSILDKILYFADKDAYSLGDISTEFSGELKVDEFEFRKLTTGSFGAQALLLNKTHLNLLKNRNLDRPSDDKIFKILIHNQIDIYQLVTPTAFLHREVKSVCWPTRTKFLKKIEDEPDIPVESKRVMKTVVDNNPYIILETRENFILENIVVTVHGLENPIVISGIDYPTNGYTREYILNKVRESIKNGAS